MKKPFIHNFNLEWLSAEYPEVLEYIHNLEDYLTELAHDSCGLKCTCKLSLDNIRADSGLNNCCPEADCGHEPSCPNH